ncbi:MAG: glucose-6-phosphate isomerase [Parvibaculum sp.]|nr:glucose-6-phosphate isomerase [Parvibaculum sp.]MDR3499045.1 glucose-6-phosphate isomerase [Parvibaculum sp.]
MPQESLPYEQSIDTCFEERIGEGGLSRKAFEAALAEAEPALAWLKEAHAKKTLALLRVPERKDDLGPLREVTAKLLDNTTDLFIFGIGGSSLGAQTIAQLTGWGTQSHTMKGPRVHIIDNLDAGTMQTALSATDMRTARFLVVSKSGGTVEPAIQMLAAMSAIEKAGGGKYMKHHFAVLTEPAKDGKPNALRALAEKYEFPTLEHDPGVGGRYAVLTNVGLLPADIFGLDIEAIRAGAADVLAPILAGRPAASVAPAVGAALSLALQREKGANMTVLMAYADRLERFLAWHCQLWAESLGKQGKGTTPVRALGPVDQHSQLQLYLDGPKDKMFTAFTVETKGEGPEVSPDIARGTGFAALAGHRIGDLVDAEARATIDTLAKNGRPVRTFRLKKLNERALGGLFMHFMLETIIAGKMLGIDPFDQPAVEEGKILAKKYLAEMK